MRGTRKKPRTESLTASISANLPLPSSSPSPTAHEAPLREEGTSRQSTHESSDAVIEELEQDQDNHNPQKEQEVWGGLREEYFEVIEQLPLSLYRYYDIVRELDVQSKECNAGLMSTINDYISLRRAISKRGSKLPPSLSVQDVSLGDTKEGPENSTTPTTLSPLAADPTQASDPQEKAASPDPTLTYALDTQCSSQDFLIKIGKLAEDILRASEEKINVSHTALESIDRHIRLLDQAVKDQEHSLATDGQLAYHPLPTTLSEIPAPRWSRPVHAFISPSPEPEFMDTENKSGDGAGGDDRKRGKGKRFKSDKKATSSQPDQTAVDSDAPIRSLRSAKSASVTLPEDISFANAIDVDEENKRYCYCNRPSFGEMVACDNPNCPREWYHIGCLEINELPQEDEEWYCRDCKPSLPPARKRKKR